MREKIILIDGNSIMNRAFHGIPDLTNSEGVHTNALYGFLTILFKTIEDEHPEYAVVAFDVHSPTFRHEMYSEYKAGRKPMDPSLREQMPIIHELLKAMNIKIVEKAGIEADDILGTIASKCDRQDMDVIIISGDRDLLQMATDRIRIRMHKTEKGKKIIKDYFAKDVIAEEGLTPLQIIDYKALAGDASDNYPGAKGIGDKKAKDILKSFGTVENAIKNSSSVKPPSAGRSLEENKETVLLCKELAAIKRDCDIELSKEDCRIADVYNETSIAMFKKLGFKSFLDKAGSVSAESGKEPEILIYDSFEEAQEDIESIRDRAIDNGELGMAVIVGGSEKYIPCNYFALCIEKDRVIVAADVFGDRVKNIINELMGNAGCSVALFDIKDKLKVISSSEKDNVFDAAIAAYLMDPTVSDYDYSYVAGEFSDLTFPSRKALLDSAGRKAPDKDKQQAVLKSIAYEAITALVCKKRIEEELKSSGMYNLYTDVELPLAYTLHEMELRGIRINADELSDYASRLKEKSEDLTRDIYYICGHEFNINSPKQLGTVLFEELGLPFANKTKTGYSTSADVLEKLKDKYEIVRKILEYRQVSKLYSTYAEGLKQFIDEDGRIRSTFNQTVTATGRISSTEPNLQNIPIREEMGREIRKVFIPETGYVFVDADYSQIELRVLAHMSKDRKLIDAYNQGEDIHAITASQVFNVPLEKVDSTLRGRAKAVNFGIIYGISSFGLGQDLNISRQEAAGYIDRYFSTYPDIKKFLDGLVDSAKRTGYSYTMFGRRRRINELNSSNFMQRQFGERVAMNSPIQGTAADIIKIAMINVNRRLKEEGLCSRLILQVHDELLIETFIPEKEHVLELVTQEMENAAKLEVRLLVCANAGDNWLEAH